MSKGIKKINLFRIQDELEYNIERFIKSYSKNPTLEYTDYYLKWINQDIMEYDAIIIDDNEKAITQILKVTNMRMRNIENKPKDNKI